MTIDEIVTGILQEFGGDDLARRDQAAAALQRVATKEAVPALCEGLRSTGRTCRESLRALARLGPAAAAAIPALLEFVCNPDISYRFKDTAMTALSEIGPAAVPALLEVLDHPDPHVQRRMAYILGDIGDARAYLPLLQRLQETAPLRPGAVRRGIIYALHRIAPGTVAQTLQSVHDGLVARRDWTGIHQSLQSFYALGMTAPGLIDFLRQDTDSTLLANTSRYGALTVIEKQRRKDAIPAMLDLLATTNHPWLEQNILEVLARFKPIEAIPRLCQIFNAKDNRNHHEPWFSLFGQIGATDALPTLISYSEQAMNLSHYRALATNAIGQIGGFAATQYLISCLEHPNPSFRADAGAAMALLPKRALRSDERFVLLRDLLSKDTSPEACWLALSGFLQRWPGQEEKQVAIDYAAQHIEAFDDAVRVAPAAWWEACFCPRPEAAWTLVRHLHIKQIPTDSQQLFQRLHHESLSQITHLTLGGLNLGPSVVDVIADAPHLKQLQVLDLQRNGLDPRAAAVIGSHPFFAGLQRLHLGGNAFAELHVLKLRRQHLYNEVKLVF